MWPPRSSLLLVFTIAFTGVAAAENRVLAADLALQVRCQEDRASQIETSIEQFLRTKKFRVLNLTRALRQHGSSPSLELYISSIDEDERIIQFIALPSASPRYAVTLNTRPPTKRSIELEEMIVSFATETLGCELRQINRGENGADALDLFLSEVKRVQGLFREVDAVDRKYGI